MGGIGSGGQNRISIEEHKRRGTYRPARHGKRIEKRSATILSLATASEPGRLLDAPPHPTHLGPAGVAMWNDLFTNLTSPSVRPYSWSAPARGRIRCDSLTRHM